MVATLGLSAPRIEETFVDAPIYAEDPDQRRRLVLAATIRSDSPLPAPGDLAGFLRDADFLVDEVPTGRPILVAGHNRYDANVWITWWEDEPAHLEVRVELPPAWYEPDPRLAGHRVT
jgi:hypothetical protein